MARLVFVALVVAVVALVWRARDSARGRAGKRLLLLGFMVVVVFTILFPGTTTTVAHWMGIGRGTDLVFYLTSFAVMYLAAAVYLKFKRMENRLAALVSDQALREWEHDLHSEGLS